MKTTSHIKFIDGLPIMIPNTISEDTSKYYISYNNRDIASYGSDTTALHINETSQFLILNGNHIAAYKDLNTLEDCLKYFYDSADKNFRSEHGKVFKMVEGKGMYTNGGY